MADHFEPAPLKLGGDSNFTVANNATGTIALSGESDFAIEHSVPTLIGSSTFTVQGLKVVLHEAGYHHVAKYVGESNVPQDVKRTRRSVHELLRRMGTPVLIKKMLVADDMKNGTVEESANFDDVYGQTRNRDPLSHGIGFVSVEKHPNEWIDPATSKIFYSQTNPGAGYIPAPKYRGFGPGLLTYVIEPDAAEDFFKHTPEGVLMKVQTATAQTAWWPDINDNDLLIHVELDRSGYIVGTQERYQAKMTNPISLRGTRERRGRQEYTGDFGSRYVVNQTFQMVLLPNVHEFQQVETDR